MWKIEKIEWNKRIKETNNKCINYSLFIDETHIRNINFIVLYSIFNLNEFFLYHVVYLRIFNYSCTSEYFVEWIFDRIVKFKIYVKNVHNWLLIVQVQWQVHWKEYQ